MSCLFCDACVAESGVRVVEVCDKFLRRLVGLVKNLEEFVLFKTVCVWFCSVGRFFGGFVVERLLI